MTYKVRITEKLELINPETNSVSYTEVNTVEYDSILDLVNKESKKEKPWSVNVPEQEDVGEDVEVEQSHLESESPEQSELGFAFSEEKTDETAVEETAGTEEVANEANPTNDGNLLEDIALNLADEAPTETIINEENITLDEEIVDQIEETPVDTESTVSEPIVSDEDDLEVALGNLGGEIAETNEDTNQVTNEENDDAVSTGSVDENILGDLLSDNNEAKEDTNNANEENAQVQHVDNIVSIDEARNGNNPSPYDGLPQVLRESLEQDDADFEAIKKAKEEADAKDLAEVNELFGLDIPENVDAFIKGAEESEEARRQAAVAKSENEDIDPMFEGESLEEIVEEENQPENNLVDIDENLLAGSLVNDEEKARGNGLIENLNLNTEGQETVSENVGNMAEQVGEPQVVFEDYSDRVDHIDSALF